MSREELDAILTFMPEASRAPLITAYLTGWRFKSSITQLEVRDVDLAEGLLRLRPEISKTGEPGEFPLLPGSELRALIEHQLERNRQWAQAHNRIIPWLFHDNGQPLGRVCRSGDVKSKVAHQWQQARKRVGLPNALIHNLRRGFATRGIAAGLDQREVMSLGGWRSDAVFQRYRIVTPQHKRAAAGRLVAFEARQANVQNDVQSSESVPAVAESGGIA